MLVFFVARELRLPRSAVKSASQRFSWVFSVSSCATAPNYAIDPFADIVPWVAEQCFISLLKLKPIDAHRHS
jgi:hypothetical protein